MTEVARTNKIRTADAEPIQSSGWRWPAAYLVTVVLLFPAVGLRALLPGAAGQSVLFITEGAMIVTFFGGLYFGLDDFYKVKRSAEDWNPNFWGYFLLNFFLTPIVSFSVYLVQRYRHTQLKTELAV